MKKLLNSLYILDDKAYLSLDGENIVCLLEGNEKFRLPFSNIESIYCFNYNGCSPALLGKCAEYGIALNFLSPQGKFLARIQGKVKGNIYLRKAQFDLLGDAPLILCQNTVAAKLSNTRYVLRRSIKDNPDINEDGRMTQCIKYLEETIEKVYAAQDTDEARGLEGSAAKAYFDVFDRMILQQKEDFFVTGRVKRPPLDRVNAMLSFLYTIATSSYASALESVGLDSYLGFYHCMRPGRSSLACDLVEEFRCIVDRLVLTMINLKKVNKDDFEVQPSGAMYLNDSGKRKVLSAWQEKKHVEIKHPYINEKIPIGLLPFVQSTLLAKYIRGEIEEYPCFIMK